MILPDHGRGRLNLLDKWKRTGGRRVLFAGALLTFICGAARAQNARDIVARSLQADHDTVAVAAQYTYQENQITKELDGSGHVTKTTSEVRDILFLGGKRYEHLIEKNGKPLPPDQARKEQAKLDKAAAEASRLTPEERDKRFAEFVRQRAKQRDELQGIPDAYTFTLLEQPMLGDRTCYLIQAQPRSGYRGKNANLLRHLSGKLWIDKKDYEWVRLETDVLDDISFGFFLAKLSKGARFTLERVRINDEVWLPKQITVKASARALIKSFHVEQTISYSNYRKFSTGSRLIPDPDAK